MLKKQILILLLSLTYFTISGQNEETILDQTGLVYQINKIENILFSPIEDIFNRLGMENVSTSFISDEINKCYSVFEQVMTDSLSEEYKSQISKIYSGQIGIKLKKNYKQNIFEDIDKFNDYRSKIDREEINLNRFIATKDLVENAGSLDLESMIKSEVLKALADIQLVAILVNDGMEKDELEAYLKTDEYNKMLVYIRRQLFSGNSNLAQYDFNRYLYFYSSFTENELAEYNNFLKSEAGKRYSQCIQSAFRKSLDMINKDMIEYLLNL